jgi:hypothetical protein
MLIPLINAVQANGDEEEYLEAKNLTAIVDNENETVTLLWENIDTLNYLILQDLKTTNYSLYRSDEPLNSSNYQQAELIADNIQACLTSDDFTDCRNREHIVVYNIPPNTDGNYYYGIVSILENGTATDNFSLGDAALNQPVYEYGSPITSPYGLQANYNLDNSTTQLSWIDASRVDSSIDTNHTTSIWSHLTQANRSNWDTLNKTQIITNVSSSVNTFEIIHSSNVSRANYYTVIHTFEGQNDTRFLSGNTLTQALIEDNIGSLITGTLQAEFNATNSQTSMNWTDSTIQDVNHTLHIWRSVSAITNLHADGVEEIIQLPANSTYYNFTVPSGFSGESYYLITLSDEIGNHQTNLNGAPQANLNEYTLTSNENIVTSLVAAHSTGVTKLTWIDLVNHSEATYQIWRSTTGQINTTSFGSSSIVLLDTVDSEVQHYNHTLEDNISGKAWYAVTAVASFGTQNVTIQQTNISLSLNSLALGVIEDTRKPVAPTTLTAQYLVNGTTQVRWIGDGIEEGTIWKIYRNLYSDLTEESFWILVAQIENSGATQHTVFVDTVAQSGEVVTPVYALGASDVFGNSISFENWRLSSSVVEDRQPPNVQLKLYDSQMKLETSRWFDGGETSTFSNLKGGNYTIKFILPGDTASIAYTFSTDGQSKIIDLEKDLAEIEIEVSKQIGDITISFNITDVTGNTASFSALFCSSCLLQTTEVNQIDNTTQGVDDVLQDKSEEEAEVNIYLFIGVCISLVTIILFLMVRGPKSKKALSGLPSKDEDEWISKYLN